VELALAVEVFLHVSNVLFGCMFVSLQATDVDKMMDGVIHIMIYESTNVICSKKMYPYLSKD